MTLDNIWSGIINVGLIKARIQMQNVRLPRFARNDIYFTEIERSNNACFQFLNVQSQIMTPIVSPKVSRINIVQIMEKGMCGQLFIATHLCLLLSL